MTTGDPTYDEKALIEDLKGWWDQEVAPDDDPFAAPKAPAGTIFDALPTIDSLGAVDGLLTVQKHVPFKVTPRLIRPGGYTSFEDLTADFLSKLQVLAEKHKQKTAGKSQSTVKTKEKA